MVGAEMEGSAGSAPHVEKAGPCYVLLVISIGKESLRVRLSAANARILGKALGEDADAIDMWAREYEAQSEFQTEGE